MFRVSLHERDNLVKTPDSVLMVTISGVRGVCGVSLTPEVVAKYTAAFCSVMTSHEGHPPAKNPRTVVVGRDSRVSGPWIMNAVSGVCVAMGYQVIDIGIVPTPTVQLLVQQYGAAGGMVLTASHNPVQWNGLKFIDQTGLFLSPASCEQMFAIADAGLFQYMPYNQLGSIVSDGTAYRKHIDSLLSLPFIDANLIRSKRYRICVDSVNGAGGPIVRMLLEELGCTVVGLNLEPTGIFAHTPEPVNDNLRDLMALVPREHADLGIAVDPDVDRCVLIDQTGTPLGEEYTLALAVKFMLHYVGRRGAVVKNLSSSRANDDVAAAYGCSCYATPVGEINVAKKMVETGAVIGGEGNGGVMLPDCHIGRDAPVAIVLTLQHLAQADSSLSALKATLPTWEIVKLKMPVGSLNADAAIALLRQSWAGRALALNEDDGLRIDTADWWVHLRKSNTEPIIRVIGEARTEDAAKAACQRIIDEIQSLTTPV
eukprot:gnl/Spiro4/27010_TR13434_c0_g1_i1.p1 gnl/Spiro4/27010_TR13434_c0_g1~~gnl/Spiro4/27010_TR13434_c0_g1_i1.p1  ORF type:complete len:496 (-),score=159.84 gnl/Spiro4/27010_TR13434_c0_g1_i1:43-1494(-)